MHLLSRTFLLLFLPIALLIYWKVLKSQKARLAFLFILSLSFYALAGLQFIPLLLGLSLLTFWLAKKDQTTLGIFLNLTALILFKYWDFGAGKINTLVNILDLPVLLPLFRLALPLGLSYYVFKHIGYLLDVRKKTYAASDHLLSFLTFSTFFPQITAGPISSYNDTGAQLRSLPEKFSPQLSYHALLYLTYGIAKKLLIAESLNQFIQQGIYTPGDPQSGFIAAWAFVLLSGLQLYFDFSGYTDLALGVGHLFGVTLPENFNSPYLATSPFDFWERWHITLSYWFRLYVFFPLSRILIQRLGNKHILIAQSTANIITMALVGFWHGASWGFLLWGIYHGILLSIFAALSRKKYAWLNSPLSQAVSLIAIFGGLFFIFTTGLANVSLTIIDLLGFNGLGMLPALTSKITITLPLALIITFSGNAEAQRYKNRYSPRLATALGIILALLILLTGEPSDFTYAQF